MTREEIESVYSRDVLDRNWWGNFPEPWDLLGKDFPKIDAGMCPHCLAYGR